MADRNPFSVLGDSTVGDSTNRWSTVPSASSQHPSKKPGSKAPFPKLTSLRPCNALFEQLVEYKRLADSGRYVAHYYPQYADESCRVPRDYLLPLLLQYPTPEPVSIKHRNIEIDLLPLVYADDYYLMTAPVAEYTTWKTIAPSGGKCKKLLHWRQKLYQTLNTFPIRSTTQFKSLLNTIDELKFSTGQAFVNASILDTDPGYGELFLASSASQLNYHGLQPHDAKREIITQMNDEIVHSSGFKLYDTTILETTLPKERYELIYYCPKITPDDSFWSLTVVRELESLWTSLIPGGYLLVKLGDSREVNAAAITNRFIERSLPRSSYYGTIGMFEMNDKKATPVWVWSKSPDETILRWNNKMVIKQHT